MQGMGKIQTTTERRRFVPRRSDVEAERVQELLAFKWQRVRDARSMALAGDQAGVVRILDELLAREADVWAARADYMRALRDELEALRASMRCRDRAT